MENHNIGNKGYVLIATLLVLVVVTLLGTWALKTTSFEIKISGNQQNWNEKFNVIDGAVKKEGGNLAFARSGSYSWYMISDPDDFNNILFPTTTWVYNFGNDINFSEFKAVFPDTSPYYEVKDPAGIISKLSANNSDYDKEFEENPVLWPRWNLLNSISDDTNDYAYYVKYLYPDSPPKGYSAASFTSYKFKINARQSVGIEIGGVKVGVKKK